MGGLRNFKAKIKIGLTETPCHSFVTTVFTANQIAARESVDGY